MRIVRISPMLSGLGLVWQSFYALKLFMTNQHNFVMPQKKRAKAAPASAREQLINMVINFFMLFFRRFFVVIYSNSLRVTERLLVPESGYSPTNS
jgi:hypothetical protein